MSLQDKEEIQLNSQKKQAEMQRIAKKQAEMHYYWNRATINFICYGGKSKNSIFAMHFALLDGGHAAADMYKFKIFIRNDH